MKKLLLLLVLGVAACTTSEVTTVTSTPDGKTASVLESKYPRLLTDITAQNIRMRRNAGLLQVSVDIKNEDLAKMTLHYKFKWFDADGFEVQPEGRPWIPLTLLGEELHTVQALAPQNNVTSFKIMLEEI